MTVVRVPAYSPHAVAEHTLALVLALDRKIDRAGNRVREGNFAPDGLMGREIRGRAVGIVGTARSARWWPSSPPASSGRCWRTTRAWNEAVTAVGGRYVPLETLLAEAEIVTLHCPLTPDTRHLIRPDRLAAMRDGALLVNTARGALIDVRAVIEALKTGKLGGVGLDVYEEEDGLFGVTTGEIIATTSRASADVPECGDHRPPAYVTELAAARDRRTAPSTTCAAGSPAS